MLLGQAVGDAGNQLSVGGSLPGGVPRGTSGRQHRIEQPTDWDITLKAGTGHGGRATSVLAAHPTHVIHATHACCAAADGVVIAWVHDCRCSGQVR